MKLSKFIFILSAVVLTSCQADPYDKAKTTMKEWYKQKVVLPKQVEYLNAERVSPNDTVSYYHLKAENTFYIIHYFDAGCDKCISDLTNAQKKIKTVFHGRKVKFIFIADAPNTYFAKTAIKRINFKYPVYYEKEPLKLLLDNHMPIGDPLYKTFLLNSNSELLLFGSVFDNAKAQSFFSELIAKQ